MFIQQKECRRNIIRNLIKIKERGQNNSCTLGEYGKKKKILAYLYNKQYYKYL